VKLRLVVLITLCFVVVAPALFARASLNPSTQPTQESKPPARPSPGAGPIVVAAPAQKSPAAKPTPAPSFTDPQKLDAVNLLVKEIGRAKFYRRPSHAARVLIEATDAVWDYRDSIAEKGLRDAWALTDRELDDEGKIKGAERDALSTHALRTELRSDILAVAERHNPSLVKELIATIEEKGDATEAHNMPIAFGTGSFREQQLAQFARQLAPTDPRRAVELASESLDYGMPQELQGIFQELDTKAPALAHDLFARAVRAFRSDQSLNIYDAVFLSAYLRFLPRPETDAALVKSFLDAALARMARLRERQFLTADDDEGMRVAMLKSLDYLQPFFQAYDPERANEVVALAQQLRPELPADEYESGSLHLSSTDGDPNAPENILSRAASEKNPDTRDALYTQAALRYANLKKFDRAFESLLMARVTDKRTEIMTSLRFQHAKYLAETGELNDAAKALEKIADPEMRAEATVIVANAARKKKDFILARYVLDQTVKLMSDHPASAPHARAYLWIASAYALVDPPMAFEMMWAAVKAANAAPTLVELYPARKFLMLGGTVREGLSVGGTGGDFRPGFRALARTDYTRAAQIADGFKNELFRGLAVVSVAAAVLKEKPKAQPSQTDDENPAK
jgi:hypothetical protein